MTDLATNRRPISITRRPQDGEPGFTQKVIDVELRPGWVTFTVPSGETYSIPASEVVAIRWDDGGDDG